MQKRPKLIALYSPVAGSGKTTVARILEADYGYKRVSFAAPLKAMVSGFLYDLGMKPEQLKECLDGKLKESKLDETVLGDLTPRRLMQTLGTEWGRNVIQEDLWVRIAEAKIKRLWDKGHDVVIDDMRFPNEYTFSSLNDGLLVIVDREKEAEGGEPHASIGLLTRNTFDFTIKNNSSIEALEGKVHYLMKVFHNTDKETNEMLNKMEENLS